MLYWNLKKLFNIDRHHRVSPDAIISAGSLTNLEQNILLTLA